MKKYIIILISVVFLLLSCEKAPLDNGLDGMWQLVSVEHNGKTSDCKSKRIYWCFRRNLVQYNQNDGERFFSHAVYGKDTLTLVDFYHDSVSAVEGDDNVSLSASEYESLWDIGIHAPYDGGTFVARFLIKMLDDSRMVLCNDSSRLDFRKF